MNEKKQTIETYNRSAEAMEKRYQSLGARVFDIEKAFSYINKENPFVFEIGSGNGRDAKEIIKRTSNYLGIDASKKMIELARKYIPKGKFELADVEHYDFPKNIDIIFSFASLVHSNKDTLREIFKKVYNSLNKSGIFFISLKLGTGKKTKTDEFGKRTYYYYIPEDIKNMARKKFKVLYKDQQKVLNSKWFTIILQKI